MPAYVLENLSLVACFFKASRHNGRGWLPPFFGVVEVIRTPLPARRRPGSRVSYQGLLKVTLRFPHQKANPDSWHTTEYGRNVGPDERNAGCLWQVRRAERGHLASDGAQITVL